MLKAAQNYKDRPLKRPKEWLWQNVEVEICIWRGYKDSVSLSDRAMKISELLCKMDLKLNVVDSDVW